ncbi:MAG: Spore protein SP21 [Elusimicrobia bacterium]|nr:Spore protein SP21 [Elusimicrobiota bacterium]
MSIKDLIPFKQSGKKSLPIKRSDGDPFDSLHREINRVFENFTKGFWDMSPFSGGAMEQRDQGDFMPRTDITEDDKQIRVSVELPGMDEKDVQVSLANDELVIRGEKKTESEDKGKDWYRAERSYGSFHRTFALPEGIDSAKADASFKKGVLTVTIPKKADAQRDVKKITVRHE